jgi:predicted protein tyrosine phosphatase
MPNLLFICSRNQWRSLTAETIFRKREDITVKSAGTVAEARIRVNSGLLKWSTKARQINNLSSVSTFVCPKALS